MTKAEFLAIRARADHLKHHPVTACEPNAAYGSWTPRQRYRRPKGSRQIRTGAAARVTEHFIETESGAPVPLSSRALFGKK